jgi:hypothetical protein
VWHDHTPQRPNLELDEEQQAAADLEREVPYTVIVSFLFFCCRRWRRRDGGCGEGRDEG